MGWYRDRALIAILGVALFRRAFALPFSHIWIDEHYTLEFVALPPAELVPTILLHQPHFPTYYVLLQGWLAVIGGGELAARGLSVVAGGIGVVAIYVLGRTLAGRATGLVAAWLYALHPMAVYIDQTIRMYAFLGAVAAATWYALVRARRGSQLWQRWYTGAGIVLVWLHYFGVLYWVAGVVADALDDRRWRHLYRRHRWASLGAVPAVGWALQKQLTTQVGGTVHTVRHDARASAPNLAEAATRLLVHHLDHPFEYALLVVLPGLALAGLASTHPRWRRSLVAWAAVPVVAIIGISVGIHRAFEARYLTPVLYPLLLAVAVGITRLPRRESLVAVALVSASWSSTWWLAWALGVVV